MAVRATRAACPKRADRGDIINDEAMEVQEMLIEAAKQDAAWLVEAAPEAAAMNPAHCKASG